MAPTLVDMLMMVMGLSLAVIAIVLDRNARTLSIWKSAIPLPVRVASGRAAIIQSR